MPITFAEARTEKACAAAILKADDAERTLTHLITRRVVDRDGDVVEPRGGRLDNYRKNPVVLLGHYGDMPIGRNLSLEASDEDIVAVTQFAGMEQAHEEAETVYRLYRDGFMRAWSIGFRGLIIGREPVLPGQKGVTFLEWELYEYSAVPIPSNPDALSRMVKAYTLPEGATEADLLNAVRKNRKVFFDVGAVMAKAAELEDVKTRLFRELCRVDAERDLPIKKAEAIHTVTKDMMDRMEECQGHLKSAMAIVDDVMGQMGEEMQAPAAEVKSESFLAAVRDAFREALSR